MEGSEEVSGKEAETGVKKVLIYFLSIRNDCEEKILVELCRDLWQIVYSLPTIYMMNLCWLWFPIVFMADFQTGGFLFFQLASRATQSQISIEIVVLSMNYTDLGSVYLFLIVCASENLRKFSWHLGCLEI